MCASSNRLLAAASDVGKKLDFLLQEMQREANTLLSKTPGNEAESLEITELALEIKVRDRKNPRTGAEHRMSQSEPLVLIVSGPSGSGKSTLVQKILELPGTMLSVSSTTRAPRETESAGKWYNFVSEAQFQGMVARGEFLEYAQVFGKNWYGTPL